MCFTELGQGQGDLGKYTHHVIAETEGLLQATPQKELGQLYPGVSAETQQACDMLHCGRGDIQFTVGLVLSLVAASYDSCPTKTLKLAAGEWQWHFYLGNTETVN